MSDYPVSPITGKPSRLTAQINASVDSSLPTGGPAQPVQRQSLAQGRAAQPPAPAVAPGLVEGAQLRGLPAAEAVARSMGYTTQQPQQVQQSQAVDFARVERSFAAVLQKMDRVVTMLDQRVQAQQTQQVQRAGYAQPTQRAQYQQPAYEGQSRALRLPQTGIQPGGIPNQVRIIERGPTSARGAAADAVSGPPTHLQWTRPQFEGPSLHERMIEWAARQGYQ